MTNVFGVDNSGSITSILNVCQGRLTLTSGTPVTTSDVTGASTIYFTPYNGNCLSLYNGSNWQTVQFDETSLALGTLTSGKNYDIFAYDNSGTIDLEMIEWTNDTTRATDLTMQDGVLIKSGDATRRYLGSFRTTSTTTTEDSNVNRFLFNNYNRRHRSLKKINTGTVWTYATSTWRYSNNDSTQKINIIAGLSDVCFNISVNGNISTTGSAGLIGIGWNNLTPLAPQALTNLGTGGNNSLMCTLYDNAVLGLNYFANVEYVGSGGHTATFLSNSLYTVISGYVIM